MSNKNLCVFCQSSSFGPGCPFSPSGIHFHASDPKKCCFCGSVASGPGCPFNPNSRVHIHGVDFNTMVKDSIDKSITLGYLMNELSKPITDMEAFKLGLINESGKRIKKPTTDKETQAYGPIEEYIISLKQIIGNQIDVINETTSVKLECSVKLDEYSKHCESKLNYEEKFSNIGNELKETIVSAYNAGLSKPLIEKLIVESILENKKN